MDPEGQKKYGSNTGSIIELSCPEDDRQRRQENDWRTDVFPRDFRQDDSESGDRSKLARTRHMPARKKGKHLKTLNKILAAWPKKKSDGFPADAHFPKKIQNWEKLTKCRFCIFTEYILYRATDEIKWVYLPSQLERTLQLCTWW